MHTTWRVVVVCVSVTVVSVSTAINERSEKDTSRSAIYGFTVGDSRITNGGISNEGYWASGFFGTTFTRKDSITSTGRVTVASGSADFSIGSEALLT